MVLGASRTAAAQEPWSPRTPPLRVEAQTSLDLFAKRFFTLTAPTILASADTRGGGRGAMLGEGLTLVGAGAGAGLVFDDRWLLPVVHAELSMATGRSPRVLTALDGSIAEIHPWTAKEVVLHMLGFGVRGKHRRWMAEASVMPGLALTWMDASIARGDVSTPATALLVSFSLRAEIAGCRRLDPEHRFCVVLAPIVYEHGFFNGGALGLRWETGP